MSPTSNIGQSTRRRLGSRVAASASGSRPTSKPAPGPPGYFDAVMPGFSAFVGAEPIHAVLEGDGSVTVHTRQVPHGQGHETTLAQVAADELGVPVEAIRVRYGDTNFAPFGITGTGGSLSAAMAGGAVGLAARTLREHIVDIAEDLLEASPADIVIEDGDIHVAGVPTMSLTFREVAEEAMRRGVVGNTDRLGRGEAIRIHRDWNGGEGDGRSPRTCAGSRSISKPAR